MEVSDFPEFDDHELISVANDSGAGLRSIVAIHNTNLGPATGGTRYLHYSSEKEAIRDALKLSRAMTYKCALAGVPYGGGKGVIMANSSNHSKRALLVSYAKKINLFNGSFSTGEDVGINESDIETMVKYSRFVNGKPKVGGDLGPWTAWGLLYAMRVALNSAYGTPDLGGRTFAIKGMGKIGSLICELIYERGGKVKIADIDKRRLTWAKKKFPQAEIIKPAEIHKQKVDVYVPCALSNEFNKKTIPQLRCQIICGGANNQLASREDGNRLHSWGILYVPDYLANAGGLINVAAEMNKGGYKRTWVKRKVKAIGRTAQKVIDRSQKKNQPTSEIADELAEKIFMKKSRMSKKTIRHER